MQVKTLKILIMLAFLSIQLNGVSYGSWSVDDDLDEQVIEEEKTNVLSEEDIVEKLELAKKNKRTIKCYDGHPICSHGGVAKCKGDYPPVCIGGEVSCCRNYNGSLNCDEFGEEVNLAINHSVNCVSAEKKK